MTEAVPDNDRAEEMSVYVDQDLAFAGEDVPEPDDIDSVIERRVSNAE